MDFWFLTGAALVSLSGALIHGTWGHRIYMGNINASNLYPTGKPLSLVNWHMFTIFLVVGAVALAYAAYTPAAGVMVYPIIIINALGALMFLGLGIGGHRILLRLPGAYLTGSTAVLGWLGVS